MQGNEKHNEGLCIVCAKELGVPQVSEYMKQMGLSEEDIEESYKALFGGDEMFEDYSDNDDDDDDIVIPSPSPSGTEEDEITITPGGSDDDDPDEITISPPGAQTGDNRQAVRYIILLLAGIGFMVSAILYGRRRRYFYHSKRLLR
jgi:hypothetical protein